jgi:pyrimidine operon attenuation protein/uracil phosphoribosyltransferase
VSQEIVAEGQAFEDALKRLRLEILERYSADGEPAPLAIVGIRTGGAHLARRLAARIEAERGEAPEFGLLDITLYRDDILTGKNPAPLLLGTEIGFDVQGKYLVLVDDVLYTGRTVRAALDSLLDLGRPVAVRLAVLVDRGHRELPIAADACGLKIETASSEHVKVVFTEEGEPSDRVVREEAS